MRNVIYHIHISLRHGLRCALAIACLKRPGLLSKACGFDFDCFPRSFCNSIKWPVMTKFMQQYNIYHNYLSCNLIQQHNVLICNKLWIIALCLLNKLILIRFLHIKFYTCSGVINLLTKLKFSHESISEAIRFL